MARVKTVQKSRVERYCYVGDHIIPVGSLVRSAAPGFRARPKYACAKHPFKPSDLTTSAAAAPMSVQEDFDEAIGNIDMDVSPEAFRSEIQSAAETLRDAAEEYLQERESALDAWENGNSTLEEYRDTAQSAYDEIEDFVNTAEEEWDGDQTELDWAEDEPDEDEVGPDVWQDWKDASEAHDAAVDSANDYKQALLDAAQSTSSSLEWL